ncbi:stress responsive A/B barrel domain-containing protein [Dendryphion nanum]|uniref:Stress responsive A/B barrel domain-containing protein n=1 Tax=Dendryphion nanum TaxID=256645 RepID=A0A9P9IEQ3_9PLEO|nr:stress responsive A/B barrel domain-containing protein [Dendryphion nanum]
MTIIHIVLFKFLPTVSTAHKQTFASALKALKSLSCVQNNRLLVGGPSITDPIERSAGFEFALLSYHQDWKALEEYQKSDEHHRVTSELLWPFKEKVVRFDFEVDEEDEYMCQFMAKAILGGKVTGLETPSTANDNK